MIAIFSALKEEVKDFKKGMEITGEVSCPDCRIFEGTCFRKKSLLVLTGMGKERAQRATENVLDRFPVRVLISTGFGGSLNAKTGAGDVIVYSGVLCNETPEEVLYPDQGITFLAAGIKSDSGFRSIVGSGVTISEVCCSPKSKINLGLTSGADVVDMESYWIGRIARRRNLPFIVVRSIFDTVEDDLSFLNTLTIDGQPKPFRAVNHFVRNPGQVKQALVLSANSKKAGRNLAIFLNQLIKEI